MKTQTSTPHDEVVLKRFYKTVVNGFGYEPPQQRYFNFPEQKPLSETDILEYIEAHMAGLPAQRIYLGQGFYIEQEFYGEALRGMLKSFEKKEEYEVCNRIARLLFKATRPQPALLAKAS
jgi:demethoxyubiquinone hydroxylase (CLK1/Coq7/Cat5 family)